MLHLSSFNDEWAPRPKDIKTYLHFDRRISAEKVASIANDPERVAKHAYYPFLRYSEAWMPYRPKNPKFKAKKRPIRYAARVDSAIFAKYRTVLAERYEAALNSRGLTRNVIAYRQVQDDAGRSLTNIDFAKEAFLKVSALGNCRAFVIDISQFFESLDHQYLMKIWTELHPEHQVPPDELSVFRAITKYTVVDADPVMQRLGLYAGKDATDAEHKICADKRRSLKKKGYKQVCSPQEFRDYVTGGKPGYPSLIQKHNLCYGIPQGLPISDIVANMYLLHFDEVVSKLVADRGGIYRRYSDDILILEPTTDIPFNYLNFLQNELHNIGKEINIKPEKVSEIHFFKNEDGTLRYQHVRGKTGKNGLEYLGFRFDGNTVHLRDRTIANLNRKFLRRSRGAIASYIRRYRSKPVTWLISNFYAEKVLKGFLREVRFSEVDDPSEWTFFSYARKSSIAFTGFNRSFSRQLNSFRRNARDTLTEELQKQVLRKTKDNYTI